MIQESSLIPPALLLLSNTVTAILTFAATLLGLRFKRKREDADTAKTHAEARQINVNTDLSLIQSASVAIVKAERMQQERDHWERKASDLVLDLEDSRNANSEKEIRLRLHDYQMKRLKGLLDAHGISYSEADKHRESDC
jgi:hypothetical protein